VALLVNLRIHTDAVNAAQWRNQDFVSGVAVSLDGRTFCISRHCHSVTGLQRTVKLKNGQFLES
jgi:hypothetical protein